MAHTLHPSPFLYFVIYWSRHKSRSTRHVKWSAVALACCAVCTSTGMWWELRFPLTTNSRWATNKWRPDPPRSKSINTNTKYLLSLGHCTETLCNADRPAKRLFGLSKRTQSGVKGPVNPPSCLREDTHRAFHVQHRSWQSLLHNNNKARMEKNLIFPKLYNA